MLAKSFWRTTALVFVVFVGIIQSPGWSAQQSDIEPLQQQIQQLKHAGKYAEVLAVQRRVAALTEKIENADAGRPGQKTAAALVDVAWYALLAHHFKEALAASTRAHAIAPTDLAVEIKRAHALLLSGRVRDARAIYRAYKGKPTTIADDDLWEDVIADDIEALAKVGVNRAPLKEISAELGGKSSAVDADLTELRQKIQELVRTGSYKEAEAEAQKCVELTRQRYSESHPKFAFAISSLARALKVQGRYGEAEPLYERALAIDEKVLGSDHVDVGAALKDLGELYRARGRYAEAEPLYKRSLAIAEKVYGPDHQYVGFALNELAELYRDEGRYAEAEPLYKRALAINEKALGPDHQYVGAVVNNLAALYQDEERYAEAEPLFKRALAINEKTLGPDHPQVDMSLNNLALLYRRQGRYDEAELFYKRALATNEKALGPDHPDFGRVLEGLALLYLDQSRLAEAEPLFKRAITIYEKALGPEHREVGIALDNLAELYEDQRRYAEAEPLLKRALAIIEKALGPDHRYVGTRLNNLAELYLAMARYSEAEPLLKRALAIDEKSLGPDRPTVGTLLNNLGGLYQAQGRYAEAEPLFKRALAIQEKSLGPDHPSVATDLNNLAGLHFGQADWANAVNYLRSSLSIAIRRARRGANIVGGALTGKRKSEAEQVNDRFLGLIKAAFRLAAEHPNEVGLPSEMFQMAQWARSSVTAESLAQMASRGAKGDAKLAALVRERQDLVAEWQNRDSARSADVAQPPERRDSSAEGANVARLAAIDNRIAEIDKHLAADFPDYAALVSPASLSVEDVQAQLGVDEALVLFLDTPKAKATPEETFIWVVTKTDVRWVRSELGTAALSREVAALRCGLDYEGAWIGTRCNTLLQTTDGPGDGINKPLPFDLAHAHMLCKALFSQIEGLIKDKQLLIVPSGPLTQLPFQVLVQSLPSDVSAGERSREVARLGTDFANLSDDDRKRLELKSDGGVRIVKVTPGTAAEAAGLKPDDVVLSLDGVEFASYQRLIEAIRAHAPGTEVAIRILRNGAELTITATLGTTTIREWIPRFLASGEGKSIDWLIRTHAITVLPAVSSLKALRQFAKQSQATEPYIGFGDPLLDGEPKTYPDDAIRAKLAREKQCTSSRVASISSLSGARATTRGSNGTIDVADIRRQLPLPETADELCDVADDLGVDPATHLFLGARATETEVKRLSAEGALAKYQIVHFATHGLVAGDLSGTLEPGLLLTPPDQATERDDGYLSASEVAALKLDADWVILSACNTAAGDTKDADALSGLARAFFYAGARSVLVSHWSVNSDATVKLITKAVAEVKSDPKMGRAEALRRSMLAMIDKGHDFEAHPAFWAPFVLVGEGAPTR